MDINITDAINRQLVQGALAEFHNKERDYTHFHPSQWDKCHRQIAYYYYHAKGFIEVDESSLKFDPVLQRIFGNGHFMHDRWRGYLEKTGALMGKWECPFCHLTYGKDNDPNAPLGVLRPKECEKCSKDVAFIYHEMGFYEEETWWGGHVDAIIDVNLFRKYQLSFVLKENGENNKGIEQKTGEDRFLVIDFKTINPRGFSALKEPMPDHITQMQIYLYLSGLKYGKFIYEDKWTQNTKEYLVVRDDTMLAVKKEEAVKLRYLLMNRDSKGRRVLPPRAHQARTDKECLQCKFRGHCWR